MIELLLFGIGGYLLSKDFTKRKLRFVDIVHAKPAPLIAGAAVAIVAAPVAWLLPLIGAGTAIGAGIGVGLGVRSAQKERHLLNG